MQTPITNQHNSAVNAGAFSPASIFTGSEVPIDPRVAFSKQPALQNRPQQPASAPIVKAEPEEQSLAVTASNRPSKRRAVSEATMDDISEEDEDDLDDYDALFNGMDDAPPASTSRSRKGKSAKGKGSAASATGGSKKGAAKPKNAAKNEAAASASNAKKAAAGSAVSHPHALVDVPEWTDRPSREEYEKLSSREKRQLRNKISARNFRHRRKVHIDTLEAEIRQKDDVIGTLQEEVSTLRSENQGLRADIEVLKKNWESIAAKITASATIPPSPAGMSTGNNSLHLTADEDDLYGAGSLPALSPPSSSASTNGDAESVFDAAASTVSSSIGGTASSAHSVRAHARPHPQTKAGPSTATRRVSTRSSAAKENTAPNVRKDISPSTGSSFWDAAASPFSGFGGRAMDVHTTFVPDFNIGSPAMSSVSLSGKPQQRELNPSLASLFAYGGNVNPGLNNLSEQQVASLREHFGSSAAIAPAGPRRSGGDVKTANSSADPIRDSFFDTNPFLVLRNDNMQDYRGQLYSKLANNIAGIQTLSHASKAGHASPPAGLRPAFFSASPVATEQSTISASSSQPSAAVAQHVGALATKTLFEKLSTAFWDAFTGEQPQAKTLIPQSNGATSSSRSKHASGSTTMADVVTGRSKLVLVSTDAAQPSNSDDEQLARLLSDKLDIVKQK